jgi:hypothetical protein
MAVAHFGFGMPVLIAPPVVMVENIAPNGNAGDLSLCTVL